MELDDRALPLTRGQLDIWLAQETGHFGTEWQLGLFVKIEGTVDRDAPERAIRRVAHEAEPARAAIFEVDGQVFQRANDYPDVELAFYDLSSSRHPVQEARGVASSIQRTPMPFTGPLFEFALFRTRLDQQSSEEGSSVESDVFTLTEARLIPGPPLPLVIEPAREEIDAVAWATAQRRPIRELLLRHGGILFRGFTGGSVETFRSFIAAVSGEPLPYMEGSSPRHEVADRVYTSTDYPARHRIPLHNELSYSKTWPLRLFFHCVVPPASGGATPVADCRNVYQRISPALRQRLEERDYLYVRHFDPDIGLGWQESFQTNDRAEVERYCADNDIELTWGPGEELTTRQRRPVSAAHSETGEMTWFNHLTFFHVSTLDPMVAEALLSMGKENLPNNTYYGHGAEIESAALDELRAAYEAETAVIPWQEGDIMMLDNMLVAHSREAYRPPRQIVVGMAEPWSRFGGKGR